MTLLLSLSSSNAQVKLRLEPGLPLRRSSYNSGELFNIEPHIAISNSKVIGLRFAVGLNTQIFKNNESLQFILNEEKDNAVFSFMPTFDYYFNEKYTRPYLGLGIGYCLVSSITLANTPDNIVEGIVNNQIGFLLRGGLEVGSTRLGLEYNLIPEADTRIESNIVIGKLKNSYLGLTVGFVIGGLKH